MAYLLSIGLALIGAGIAFVGAFVYENIRLVTLGMVIALIGIWFRPRSNN
jgi:hypothetical protein